MKRFFRNYIFYIIPAIFVVLAVAAGCGAGTDAASISPDSGSDNGRKENQVNAAEQAEWTLLIYMAADNDLETAAWQDMEKMESVGSGDNINVVVQWDNKGQYGNKGAKRYHIKKSASPKAGVIISPVEEDMGEINSSDPMELVNFVNWGMNKYPAKKYAVILWNHGSGWREPSADAGNRLKGICYDETSGDNMSISEMTEAFQLIHSSENRKIEFIGMDACLMGMTEVAYNLKDYGHYLTFCESSIYGWPYHYMIEDLLSNPSMDGKDLSGTIVARFRQYWMEKGNRYMASISAIDLSKMENLAESLNQFAAQSLENMSSFKAGLVRTAAETEGIDEIYNDYKDLNLFMQNIIETCSSPAIIEKARLVETALKSAVIFETHSESFSPHTSGLTIWLPNKEKYSEFEDSYSLLLLSKNGLWDEFLNQMLN